MRRGANGAPPPHKNLHAVRRGKIASKQQARLRVVTEDENGGMRANGEAVLAAVAPVGFFRNQLYRPFRGEG
ncbi:MAG: hypothetical protein WCL71_03260 [Deltaproteobacteria bacterium]